MLNNLLVYRLLIFNILCVVALGWAWECGFVEDMFLKDASYMTYVAAGLFIIGLASIFSRALRVSGLLNRLKRARIISLNGPKLIEKAAHLDDIGNLIVTAGLVGTAIGVVMMLHSFDAGSLTDPAKVVETASMLSDGVGTAFRSTIVSAIAWMVHIVNVRMLKTATVMLIEDAKGLPAYE